MSEFKKKPIPYKDTLAAPGSELHEAILNGDHQLAEKLYRESMAEFHKHVCPDCGRAWVDHDFGVPRSTCP